MTPERLAEIRAHVDNKYGYQGQASIAERDIAELLTEIDALTRERDYWHGRFNDFGASAAQAKGEAVSVSGLTAKLAIERDKLAADLAKLREALESILRVANDELLQGRVGDAAWYKQRAEHVLAETAPK